MLPFPNPPSSQGRIPVHPRAVVCIIHQDGNELILDISGVPGSGQSEAPGSLNSKAGSHFLTSQRSCFSWGHWEQMALPGELLVWEVLFIPFLPACTSDV